MRGTWQPAAGTVVAGYVIEDEVARGGMGVVYRARDLALGRRVGLKVIAPELTADRAFRERFRRESRLAAQVEHPNVVPIYRAGQDAGRLYLAMRFVDGPDLATLLRREGALAPARSVALISQIAGALDAAHGRGLVHRDVKPSNVLLDRTPDRALLADFGLTIRRDDGGLVHTGGWVGTPAYAAPEQLRGGTVDHRTDVYALGGMLHHCLTGKPPYPGTDAVAVIAAHLSEPPPRPTAISATLPAALDDVVARAMAKESSARFATAGDLAAAAQAAVGGARTAVEQHPAGDWPQPRDGLPAPPTPIVGRAREIADIAGLLQGDEVRLVTLTGPGGIGKTRLALEVARRTRSEWSAGGVKFVDLSRLRDADSAEQAIATVADAAGGRRQLVLLDNFEHVLDAVSAVPRLLATVPGAKVLATSRRPLDLLAEHEYRVPPLPDSDAIALFERRALWRSGERAASQAELAAVREICSRLDGLPLAIELAAARLGQLAPELLLRRRGPGLALLTHGPRDLPDRQRTLRATIEWSYQLLGKREQRLFVRLAVFVGSFTFGAAEAACEADFDTLGALVHSSLVLPDRRVVGERRFRMLETIREYASERLRASQERSEIERRHALWFVELAEAAQSALWGGPHQREWLERLAPEHGNLRAALDALEASGRMEEQLRMTAGVWRLWLLQGHLMDGARWVESALAHADAATATQLRQLLFGAAVLAERVGDARRVTARAQQLQALGRDGDERAAAYGAHATALAAIAEGRFDDARLSIQRALELGRAIGDDWLVRINTNNLADNAIIAGDYARGETLARESAGLAAEHQDDWTLALSIGNLALAGLLGGRADNAPPLLGEALLLAGRLDFKEMTAGCLQGVAALCGTEEPARAARLLGAAETVFDDLGVRPDPAQQRLLVRTRATLAHRLGSVEVARLLEQGRRLEVDAAVAEALDAVGA